MPIKLTTYRHASNLPDLPGNCIYHSNSLFRVYDNTPNFAPLLVTATEDGKLIGKILVCVRTLRLFLTPFSIKRCYTYGKGEYFVEESRQEEVFSTLLNHLTKEAFREAFMIEFRYLNNPLFAYKHFRANQYFPVNWSRVRNSLHSQPKATSRVSPSRLRQIRKGLKNGATIHEIKDREEIQQFAESLHKVGNIVIGRQFPNVVFFESIYDLFYPNQEAKIFVVKYKDKIIGSSLCFYSGTDALLYFSGGMKKRYARQYPGVLAAWAAMSDAFDRGFEHFEFMHVGLSFKHHGYRNFTLRFGGKQSTTRRWFCFRWQWLNKLCIKLYV